MCWSWFRAWLSGTAAVTDGTHYTWLLCACRVCFFNELSHSDPSPGLSQDFPPVLCRLSARTAVGLVQQPHWPSVVAWWCFLLFLLLWWYFAVFSVLFPRLFHMQYSILFAFLSNSHWMEVFHMLLPLLHSTPPVHEQVYWTPQQLMFIFLS